MSVISHNILAMNANRQFGINTKKKAKNTERLSSGYKINRAADDAAGLSISEKMRNQIRGLHQAMNNIEDGVSFCKVGEGALNEVHSILGRIGELAVQAANDVNDDDDRKAIDNEVQELKSEMKKIFRTTEFNGKKYWVDPYVPEVEGMPDDVMVYNSDSDKHNGYGGMLINGIRYSWDDLGVTFDSDGYFTTNDSSGGFTDYTGEKIEWETSPTYRDENDNLIVDKDMPPNIRRLYTWKADENGISVNGVKAISKEKLLEKPLGTTSEGVFYGFKFHGMNIEFMVPNKDLDNWSAISDGINGYNHGGFDNTATWEALAMTPSDTIKDSVSFGKTAHKQVIYISDSWKDKVADRTNYYSLDVMKEDSDGDGHGDGIRLVDNGKLLSDVNDSNSHTNTKWEKMSDSTITEQYSNGGYPIVDWGTEYDNAHKKAGHSESDITLNEKATYTYKDEVTGYTVNYNLTDEVSLENMEKELKEAALSTKIIAPTATYIANKKASVYNNGISREAASLQSWKTDMTFALQRDADKNFDDINDNFGSNYSVTELSDRNSILSADKIELTYSIKAKNGNTLLSMNSSIDKNTLRNMVKNGGSYTFTFNNSRYMDDMTDEDGDGYSDEENELMDESVRYGMSYSMTMKVNKVFDEPDYNTVIRHEYNRVQKVADDNGLATALIDRLCKIEHPDWYETDENGLITDNILSEHEGDRNFYSTLTIAEVVKNRSADTDGNYVFSHGGHTFILSQEERDLLVGWRGEAESKYNDDMEKYKNNLDDQYVSVYNMLKNAGLSTKQTALPRQEVTFNETATESRHTRFDVKVNDAKKHMFIQTGANSGEHQEIKWNIMSLSFIGMNGAQTLTRESAANTISKVQEAVKIVSRERSNFGAHQVRLERAFDNNANYAENLQNAESNIRDADMAKEAMNLAKHDILLQAGQSMMAQANQQNQGILQLLQS